MTSSFDIEYSRGSSACRQGKVNSPHPLRPLIRARSESLNSPRPSPLSCPFSIRSNRLAKTLHVPHHSSRDAAPLIPCLFGRFFFIFHVVRDLSPLLFASLDSSSTVSFLRSLFELLKRFQGREYPTSHPLLRPSDNDSRFLHSEPLTETSPRCLWILAVVSILL